MKRLQYIKPGIENVPMSVLSPIATSMSTDWNLGKETDLDDYDFMSSFKRAQESKPFNDDDDNFRNEDRPQ